MADVTLKGYVSKPAVKTGGSGAFSTYTVSEKVKDKKAEKGFRRVFYNVTDFNAPEPPADGSYVTVSGWLKPREYEANGQKRTSLDVIAQKVEVAPPLPGREASTPAAAGADGGPSTEKDPWDLNG